MVDALSNASGLPRAEPVLLVDALAVDGGSAVPSAFLDMRGLATAVHDDDVLYTAVRDDAPAVRSRRHRCARWRFDRVMWQGPDLVTGELKRSIGHWNPTDQPEVFHCRRGVVLLMAAMPAAPADVSVVVCRPGSIVALAGGAWHSTHVVTPEARVDNAYLDRIDVARPTPGGKPVKYGIRPPLRMTALRSDAPGIALVNFGTTFRRCALRTAAPAAVLGAGRLADLADDLARLEAFADRSQPASIENAPVTRTLWLAPASCAQLGFADELNSPSG